MSTRELLGVLQTRRGLTDQALGPPQLWLHPDGTAVAVVGVHSGWGYCWCQPLVAWSPGRDGRWRPQVTHRRTADISDAAYDAQHPDGPGWTTDGTGGVYPEGDVP